MSEVQGQQNQQDQQAEEEKRSRLLDREFLAMCKKAKNLDELQKLCGFSSKATMNARRSNMRNKLKSMMKLENGGVDFNRVVEVDNEGNKVSKFVPLEESDDRRVLSDKQIDEAVPQYRGGNKSSAEDILDILGVSVTEPENLDEETTE
jgi:hypothetical protein